MSAENQRPAGRHGVRAWAWKQKEFLQVQVLQLEKLCLQRQRHKHVLPEMRLPFWFVAKQVQRTFEVCMQLLQFLLNVVGSQVTPL